MQTMKERQLNPVQDGICEPDCQGVCYQADKEIGHAKFNRMLS